jgi:hypothetical protein
MRPIPPPPPPKKEEAEIEAHSTSSSPRRPHQPPPPKKLSVQTPEEVNSSNSRPAPPVPPPKRTSVQESSNVPDETITSPIPRRPPRPSEVKTIPVEQALEQVVDSNHSLSEPMISPKDNHSFIYPQEGQRMTTIKNPARNTTASASDYDHHSEEVRSTDITENHSGKGFVTAHPAPMMGAGEPENLIYHKNTFSEGWLTIFALIHTVQFILLLSAANAQMPSGVTVVIVLLAITVLGLVIASRYYVKKSRLSNARNVKLRSGICTPEDEADTVSDRAVYLLASACILEGITYAIFAAVLAGRSSHLDEGGYYSQETILQVLRFASITLLALHRIIRPANRIDPVRTILEVRKTIYLSLFKIEFSNFSFICFSCSFSWKLWQSAGMLSMVLRFLNY